MNMIYKNVNRELKIEIYSVKQIQMKMYGS